MLEFVQERAEPDGAQREQDIQQAGVTRARLVQALAGEIHRRARVEPSYFPVVVELFARRRGIVVIEIYG